MSERASDWCKLCLHSYCDASGCPCACHTAATAALYQPAPPAEDPAPGAATNPYEALIAEHGLHMAEAASLAAEVARLREDLRQADEREAALRDAVAEVLRGWKRYPERRTEWIALEAALRAAEEEDGPAAGGAP